MKKFYKRTTISFDPDLHQALCFKAVANGKSVSELVNQAVRLFLAEDVEDLAAFEERRLEPDLSLEDVLENWKQRKII